MYRYLAKQFPSPPQLFLVAPIPVEPVAGSGMGRSAEGSPHRWEPGE